MKIHWHEQNVREFASKFSRVVEFQRAYSAGYRKARMLGIVRELFPISHRGQKQKWILSEIKKVMANYESRAALCRGNPTVYALAQRDRLIDEFYGYQRNQWNYESLKNEASKYPSRTAFYRGNGSAYATALRKGLVEEFFPVVKSNCSRRDVLYLWRAKDQYFNGNPVYKIGVTSSDLGEIRLAQVAKGANFEYELVFAVKHSSALTLEKRLFEFGESPKYSGFNGCTEFRSFTDAELAEIKNMVSGNNE